jgi:hypothetical protein
MDKKLKHDEHSVDLKRMSAILIARSHVLESMDARMAYANSKPLVLKKFARNCLYGTIFN